jgi:hypothetical protein
MLARARACIFPVAMRDVAFFGRAYPKKPALSLRRLDLWASLVLMLRLPALFATPVSPTGTACPTARVCLAGLRIHQSVR